MSGHFSKSEPQHNPFIKRESLDQFDTWMNDYHDHHQNDPINRRPSEFSDLNLTMFDDDAMEEQAEQNDPSTYRDQTNGMDFEPFAPYQDMHQHHQPTSSSATIPVDSKVSPSESPSISPDEANTILDAEIDTNIDTMELCQKLKSELKARGIPQTKFAEKVLGRSQGTLSDLLKNPKPWTSLQPLGRSTYQRMYNWLYQPLATRLAIVNTDVPRTPAQRARKHRKWAPSKHDEFSPKQGRLVFTGIQRKTLERMYKEDQRPSKEVQKVIADHLKLELHAVVNYYLNARRRDKRNKMIQEHQ